MQVSDASVGQAIVRGAAPGWAAVFTTNGTIRNSIVVAPATNGVALRTCANDADVTGTYCNVTAIATASYGVAIEVHAMGAAGKATIFAEKVIARGGSGGARLKAAPDSSGATATINATRSNYGGEWTVGNGAAITSGGANRDDPPAYVNAAGGDYRQAAGSPTIDAGLDDPNNGAFDVDGDPRPSGTTDIGADELIVAPAATSGPAGAITDHSATLGGSVDAKGAPTSYRFEYGPTTAYGRATPATGADSGTGAMPAGATLDGPSPATTYHYRLVATNSGGVTTGADQTFTPTAAGLRRREAGVQQAQLRPRAHHPDAALPGRDRGSMLEHDQARRAASGDELARRLHGHLERATLSIAPAKQAKVRGRVSRAGRRLLGRVRRLNGRDTTAARNGAGRAKTTVAAVTIRRRRA